MNLFETLANGNIKLIFITLSGILVNVAFVQIPFQLRFSKNLRTHVLLSFILTPLFLCVGFLCFKYLVIRIGIDTYLNNMLLPGLVLGIIFVLYNLLTTAPESRKTKKRIPKLKDTRFRFTLEVSNNKDIVFSDPYDGFLATAGANSGKTKSLGRPLLREYIRHDFAGFIYDLKDFDYTRVASWLLENQYKDYPYSFYYMNFVDPSRSYRCNLVKPALMGVNDLVQYLEDFAKAYKGKDAKEDEWFDGGLGILKGVGVRFFFDYPEYCTMPHIAHFVIQNSSADVKNFVNQRPESRALAKSFIDTHKTTPKAAGSYLSSISGILGKFAFNKEVCYVLSGDDFDFNLIDPEDPKLLCVSNSYGVKDILSPVIAMMIQMTARRFTLANKVDFTFFLDEATTFRVNNFEELPSLLREYKVSFTFITQSLSKIEIQYDLQERRSLTSNLTNQFIGKTKDTYSQKEYVQKFPKDEVIKKSRGRSSSSKGGTTSSVNTREDKDYRYDTDFFEYLGPGEFVGTASNANYFDFHLQFNQLKIDEDYQVPVVREVTSEILDKNFNNIVKQVQELI